MTLKTHNLEQAGLYANEQDVPPEDYSYLQIGEEINIDLELEADIDKM